MKRVYTLVMVGFMTFISIWVARLVDYLLLQGVILALFFFICWKVTLHYISKRQIETSNHFHIENLPLPTLIIEEQKITNANSFAVALFEANSKEQLIANELNHLCKQASGLLEKKQSEAVIQATSLAGREFTTRYWCESIQSGSRETYLLLFHLQPQDRLEQMQRNDRLSILGELAVGIAHEIRNPLTSLRGFLQLMKSTNPNEDKYTKIMLSEIDRINLIVNELLLLGKPNEFHMREQSIVDLVGIVVTILRPQALLYNVQIDLKQEANAEKWKVMCDDNKIKQVLINIIQNAIESMEKEGTVTVYIQKQNEWVEVIVKDEGEGISKEKLSSIGKRFYSTKENGTGLGMMTSFHIVTEHKGKVDIDSVEGQGTEVKIALPLTD